MTIKTFIIRIFLFFSCFFLISCKGKIETEISVSEILSSPTKLISGDFYLEVISCSDYEDSRNPSDSVIQAKEKIPIVFSGAEYVECFTKEMDFFAHFKIPIALDKNLTANLASDDHINIVSNSKALLMLGIPKGIKIKLEQLKKDIFGLDIDFSVFITIKNDTDQDFSFNAFSVYVDENPFVINLLTMRPGMSFVFKLSDVSIDQAFYNGVSLVLTR